MERHRALWLYLTRELDIYNRDWRALHFAPEPPLRRLLTRCPRLDYLTADVDPRFARAQVDITRMQFEDESFDLVLCSHVLEHVPDDGRAMREIARVLKPDGYALLQHPIDYSLPATYEDSTIVSPGARLAAFGQEDHVRWYGPDFIDRLSTAGLCVDFVRYRDEVSAQDRDRYGLGDGDEQRGDDIYVARQSYP